MNRAITTYRFGGVTEAWLWNEVSWLQWYSVHCAMAAESDSLQHEYSQISLEITEILSERRTAPEFSGPILHLLGNRLQWPIAVLWLLDQDKFLLKCAQFWRSEHEHRLESFRKVSWAREFSIGECMPGTAWAERRTVWISPLNNNRNFSRASVAGMDGIVSGVGFPIYVRRGVLGVTSNAVLGVIELFSTDERKQDSALSNFLFNLGGQIGIFLERARINAELATLDPRQKLDVGSAEEGVFTIDEQSTILFANSAVERILGYEPAELIGRKLTAIMPKELQARHKSGLRRYIETGQRNVSWGGVRLPGCRKNGSEVMLEIAFGEFQRGGQRVFTGFVRKTETD